MMEMESPISMRTESADRNTVDLLTITEAAVKALGKPRFNRTIDVRCVDYMGLMGATELDTKRPQVHVYSNSTGVDAGAVDVDLRDIPTVDGYVLHSQNINASARSSCDSDRSSVLADSAFLMGTAKPVKVSAKRLNEIKSPFEAPFEAPFDTQTSSIVHHKTEPTEFAANLHTNGFDDGTLIDSVSAKPKAAEYPAGKPRDLQEQEDGQTVIRGVDNRLGDGTVGSGKNMPSESIPTLDSGYMTQHVTVIKEVQGRTLGMSDTDEGGWTADQQSEDTLSSVEAFLVSPQVHREIEHVRPEVDVLTAPECVLPDMSPFTNDASPSPGSVEVVTKHRQRPLVNKFAKYQPGCSLRQGTLMEGSQTCHMPPQTKHDTDVHISQFSLSSRDKALRHNLVKRMHKDVAVKKMVQPTLVQSVPPAGGDKHSSEEVGAESVTSAAAVAAVSAVIATQPFLKAQHDMEQKMTQLLEKLTTLPRQAPLTCQSTQHATQQETIAKLEEKLTRLTNTRLNHLEKMQLIQFQAQLALRNKKAGTLAKTHGTAASKTHPRTTQSAEAIYKKTSPKRDVYTTVREDRQAPDRQVTEMSILNTPAPRARPPMPTSYMAAQGEKTTPAPARNTRKGGLLEEILAAQEVTPQASPFPETPPCRALRDRPGAQSSRELVAVTQADTRPHSNTTPVNAGRYSNTTRPSGSWQGKKNSPGMTDGLQLQPHGGGTAPLDDYLTKYVGQIPLSPYPSLRDVTVSHASVSAPYAEAKHVLRGVHNTRNNLEANLDTILRSHCMLPGYELAPPGVAVSEHQRAVEKMVDERIKAMNADVQREVLDELLKVKDMDSLDMIPERDTSAKRTSSQLKGKGKVKVNSKVTAGPKPRVGSKVAGRITEKENVPLKKAKQTSTRQPSATASEAYLTHVYGKPAYQNQRSTVRSPYLRFQTAPKTKPAVQLPISPVLVEGVEVATRRTQTDRCWPAPATDQFYFDPAISMKQKQDAAFGSPVRGQLVAMAVPLAAPRKDGSRHPTVHQSNEVMTSTPVSGGHGFGVRFQDEIEQTEKVSKEYPKLTETVLSPVDIDSTVSALSEPAENPSHQMIPGSTVEMEGREEEEEETFVEAEGVAPLSVPGTKARCPPYHGPQFPPSVSTLGREPPKDFTGMRERDLMQRQAVDWVEQELMARIISQMHYDRHDDKVTQDVSDVSEVSERSQSPADSFIAETMGEAGLQLFLDAGCMVDNNVVNSLIKEVLLEKITSMAGEQTSCDRAPTKPQASHERHVMSDEEAVSQVPSSDVSRVPTPLPTPKLTPAASRTHSPSRSATRSVPAFPTASLEQEPSTAGSRPSAAGSGVEQSTVVLKELPAAAAPVQPKLEPATALVADSMLEPAATVSRQLEQAAALVLANTTNMLTHAAAALVSSQMAAPAGVQPTAPTGVQPSTAAPVQESDLEKAVALVLAAAPHGARERRDEECSEESDTEEGELELRTTEEHLLRDLGLTMTLGMREENKDESEESLMYRHDISTPSLTPQATPRQLTSVPSAGAVSEQIQVPDDLPTRERGTPPRSSPQPWGNPDSPGPEANPNYETDDQDRRERHTRDEGKPTVVFPDQPSSPPHAASQTLDTVSGSSEDTSYSVTDFVSEGQWLITLRSEGEVLHLPLPTELKEKAHEKVGGRQRDRPVRELSMTDDTLGDTDDFLQEDVADISRSEGEYLHQGAAQSPPLSPQRFAMHVASLRQSMRQEQAVVNQLGLATTVSLGEVVTSHTSLGQVTDQPHPHHSMDGRDGREPRKSSSQSQLPATRHPPVQMVESSPRQQPRPNPARSRPSLGQVMSTDHHKGARWRGFKPSSSGELSDEWRTLTPDQINVDALLQSNDYFGTTQSDLGSTANLTNPPPVHSAGELRHQEWEMMVKTQSTSWQGHNASDMASSVRLSVTIPSMTEDYSSLTDSASEITASPT